MARRAGQALCRARCGVPVFHIPVYLDQDVQTFLMEKAASKGVELDRLVNDLLKNDIEAFRVFG